MPVFKIAGPHFPQGFSHSANRGFPGTIDRFQNSHGHAEGIAMDGLSRWDLVLWVVVAYGVLMALVRLFLRRRAPWFRRMQQRLALPSRGTAISAAADKHGKVA